MGSLLAQVPGLTVYFLGVRPPTRVSQVGGQPHPITHLYRPAFGAGGQWRLVKAFSETTWAYPWGWLLSSLPKSWMTKYRLELAPFSYKLSFLDFVACWGMILVLGWPGGHLQTVTCLWIIVRVWYPYEDVTWFFLDRQSGWVQVLQAWHLFDLGVTAKLQHKLLMAPTRREEGMMSQ